MGNNTSAELDKQIFNLKLASKQMAKQAQKAEAQSKKERLAVKAAIEKGNNDVARIHAENSIRQKSQYLNLLRLSSRMEAVAQRVEASKNMQDLGVSMGKVVNVMGMAIDNMDLEKISNTMDEFEKQFEQLDIQSNVMNSSIQTSMALSTPEDQVDTLLQSVADEHGLELSGAVDSIQVPRNKQNKAIAEPNEEQKLEQRLTQLKK